MPAGEIERAVVDQIQAILQTPVIIVRTWRAARKQNGKITKREVSEALHSFDPLWDELFPAEQARIVQLLVKSIHVTLDGFDIRPRIDGLTQLVQDLGGAEAKKAV